MNDTSKSLFLQSGLTLYPQLGYQQLSVRRVAAHAKASPGMFHHLFADKDAFIHTILRHKYDEAFANLLLELSPQVPVDKRLRRALRFLARFVRDNLDWIHRVLADSADGIPVVNTFIRDHASRHVAPLLNLLAEGEAAGLFVPAAAIQRFTFLTGATIAPMILGGRLHSAGLLPPLFAAQFAGHLLGNAAIEERIDWAITAITRKENA